MVKRTAKYWSGGQLNIGQENSEILVKRSEILVKKTAKYWSAGKPNNGRGIAEGR